MIKITRHFRAGFNYSKKIQYREGGGGSLHPNFLKDRNVTGSPHIGLIDIVFTFVSESSHIHQYLGGSSYKMLYLGERCKNLNEL